MGFWDTDNPIANTLANIQTGIGKTVAKAGTYLPGSTNYRAGQGGSSLGYNIAQGTVGSNVWNAFPSLVKTAYASETPQVLDTNTQSPYVAPSGGFGALLDQPINTTNTGDILGTSDTNNTTSGSTGPSYEDQMRSQIEGGYNNYFNSLDQMLNGLGAQQTAQQGIANTSYNTNLTDLGLQKEQNLGGLQTEERKTGENQVKTLKDISSNIRNLMNAGNTYLGSMGAGDSSAVNQYAYGLTKLGSQQRGDVQAQTASILSDIGDRKAKLDNIYMQEKNRLNGERDTRISEIADDFANAQLQLQQAKANGQLSKSQDLQSLTTNLYNQAVQQLTNIQNQTQQRQAQLEQWAMNNATTLAGLKQNMASVGAYTAPKQSAGTITGTPSFAPQGTQQMYGGAGGGLTDEQKRLLGL